MIENLESLKEKKIQKEKQKRNKMDLLMEVVESIHREDYIKSRLEFLEKEKQYLYSLLETQEIRDSRVEDKVEDDVEDKVEDDVEDDLEDKVEDKYLINEKRNKPYNPTNKYNKKSYERIVKLMKGTNGLTFNEMVDAVNGHLWSPKGKVKCVSKENDELFVRWVLGLKWEDRCLCSHPKDVFVKATI